MIAIRLLVDQHAQPWGFLEWSFAALLIFLVLAVSAFALLVAVQLFRNPARHSRPKF